MTEQLETPNLSIVILCYRSEENINAFVDELEKELDEGKVTDYELVLVGNYDVGVPDKTPDVVRNLAARKSRITPVIYEKEGMMGWDVIKALEAATGEFISLIDGDDRCHRKT